MAAAHCYNGWNSNTTRLCSAWWTGLGTSSGYVLKQNLSEIELTTLCVFIWLPNGSTKTNHTFVTIVNHFFPSFESWYSYIRFVNCMPTIAHCSMTIVLTSISSNNSCNLDDELFRENGGRSAVSLLQIVITGSWLLYTFWLCNLSYNHSFVSI